jgi:hypothetical protein
MGAVTLLTPGEKQLGKEPMRITASNRLFKVLIVSAIAILAGLCSWVGLSWYCGHSQCERRGAALDAKIENLKQEAPRSIVIGTKRADILRFFRENGLHASFYELGSPQLIVGTASEVGCSHSFGCGNQVGIRVEVKVDGQGSAVSAPTVDSMYTDCM